MPEANNEPGTSLIRILTSVLDPAFQIIVEVQVWLPEVILHGLGLAVIRPLVEPTLTLGEDEGPVPLTKSSSTKILFE